jgi:predicted helicase
MVDVIQAVGRVMRKAEGKDFGYVILPVGIPADVTPEQALNDNKRFKAVWQVLNALRSHDERMNAVINQLDLNEEPPDMIEVIPVGTEPNEDDSDPESSDEAEKPRQLELSFPLDQLKEGIYAKLVLKVGTRHYWEDWAKDVAEIAEKHQTRIKALIDDPNLDLAEPFNRFVEGLHTIINDSITAEDAIGMLSQHLITKPVFDALFTEFDFSSSNPVSQVMQNMIDLLDKHSLNKETETLEKFYDSVRLRVEGIDNAAGKQRIITELYEGFFSKAFPKAAQSLGIVYTPIELVDFTLHAADHALRKHFDGISLSDEGVNVLDPFCGTGTFLVRLLQSGIIKPEDLARKYAKELHSNELLLLAYYIAAVNIESTYRDLATESGTGYEPFNGIVLTDTFQLSETGEGSGTFDVFPVNNERATRQKGLGIRIIVGNPPYSVGQTSENDDNKNLSYEHLDGVIANSYVKASTAKQKRSLYDSYVRAFRWASDRVLPTEEGGVIAFVSNGGFIDNNAFDGFRKTIASEFHHIYCWNLRGNQRTSGEHSRQEGGKVFGSGSRATVTITLLVKMPGAVPDGGAEIHYRDIGDYLTREEKLKIICSAATPEALDRVQFETITPNSEGDWVSQRSELFNTLVPLTNETGTELSVFDLRSNGLKTSRDAWNYNYSLNRLSANTERMVAFYNQQVRAFETAHSDCSDSRTMRIEAAKAFVDRDPRAFKWTQNDFTAVARGTRFDVEDKFFVEAIYRPFSRQFCNFSPDLNNARGQLPRIFPNAETENLAICIVGTGSDKSFSVLMVDRPPDVSMWGSSSSTKFPRYLFDPPGEQKTPDTTLFDPSDHPDAGGRTDNVTDEIVANFERKYDVNISKDDIFYFVYGVLHSPDFIERFRVDLRMLPPRIPQPDSAKSFWAFSNSGKVLSDLHVNYTTQDPWPDLQVHHKDRLDNDSDHEYRVEKLRYAKKGNETDRSAVIYNSDITITGIPDEVHNYQLAGKSAIDWIIDRYQIKTHKDSGIVNDPNDWADEHDDPTYIFDLLRRIVTVSMRTNEIVAGLPKLDFEDAGLQK